ncbi:hypothetical protein [Mannheimia varigena]|uniref:hypothetical protein n=1 Tax=Mannheimia varigena TaxID=85404 RepID=UPI0015B746CC|nr:hypothetical protein [Mannheimia varigena]MDY2946623.1 hypothetical protein [Mannheimia varigena]
MKNIFAVDSAKEHTNPMVEAHSTRESQEVQAMMVIAKRFPRDPIDAMDRIIKSCTRPSLAQSAIYSYPRGGQSVEGPSIRLAETLAQEWGNIQYGIRELSQANGESTVEAFAWDIQTNTRQVKVFQVPHIRHSKKGKTILTDPRDIYELVANNGARRLRACILGVIPGDVIEAAVEQCSFTLKASADTSTEGLKKLADYFLTNFGVTQEMIGKRYQCRFEALRPAQIVQLRTITQSLKDGMSTPKDWFDVDDPQPNSLVSTKINDEVFEKCKQTIINKESTLQDMCDNGYEFNKEQYAELEKLENGE